VLQIARATHAGTMDRYADAERPEPHQQPRMRETAPGCHNDRVECEALIDDLASSQHVAKGAVRWIVRTMWDHVRHAALTLQTRRLVTKRLISARFVFAFGKRQAARAEKVVEQNVAGVVVGSTRLAHAFLELNDSSQAEFGSRRGRRTNVVGLHGAGDQDGIGALRQGIAEVELQLADLVASHAEAREIVTLYEDLDAEDTRQARQMLDRRRSTQ
jgi:hypothetical protein